MISAQFIIQNSKLGTIFSCRPHGMEGGWGLEICWVFADSIVFKQSIFHFAKGLGVGSQNCFFCGSHKCMTRFTKTLPNLFKKLVLPALLTRYCEQTRFNCNVIRAVRC